MHPPQGKMPMNVLFSTEEVAGAVQRLAGEIEARCGAEEPVLVVALMNGAMWFAADLLRLLPVNYVLESVRVSSYGDARQSSGRLEWKSPLPDCAGMRVLVLDDVLDSGITLTLVRQELLRLGAREVLTAVMVDKPSGRRVPFVADFAGLVAPDAFLLGYGMDAAGRYRNLPYIAQANKD